MPESEKKSAVDPEIQTGGISEDSPTHARFMVLTLLCLIAAIAYISRNAISVPAKLIEGELGISSTQMGWVMSAFFWTYALSQIPSGWIGHIWGTRRSLTAFAVLWSIATALTGMVTGFWMLIGVRLIFGFRRQASSRAVRIRFQNGCPESRRGIASGLLGSFHVDRKCHRKFYHWFYAGWIRMFWTDFFCGYLARVYVYFCRAWSRMGDLVLYLVPRPS